MIFKTQRGMIIWMFHVTIEKQLKQTHETRTRIEKHRKRALRQNR